MEKTGAKRLASKVDVETALKGASIPFKTYDHAVCLNMKDLQEHVKLAHAPHIKNLAYIDKKDNLYLVIVAHDTQVGKGFWKKVGTSSGNVRMAKEDQMKDILGILMPGSVNPFSLLNDKDAKRVKAFIVDKKLMASEYWAFHPMENNATIELKRDDFLNNYVKKVVEIDFVEADLEAPAEEGDAAAAGGKKEGKGEKKEEKEEKKVHHDETEGQTKLGLDYKKAEAFPLWYSQLIIKSELIEYYDVSGCYILRPWAYAIWEQIQSNFDSWIKAIGVENSYFPLFVSEKALNKEKDHVEGFAPEVAWVTKYGTSTLKEPVAVRPTSETIMYPAYAKWITSHRDLPLKLNQWTNVVRWEFKHPTPFIRTREFLWQEGHTAHATCQDADKQVHEILDLYRRVYEELLAVPVVKGQKTEGEKFAGGYYTTTIETWIPTNGRGVQAATSHQLGQNFAKMFEIFFEDDKKERQLVWQTSWGLTTRSIGVMIMVHADDKGLVLPPKVAKTQVVVIPIISKDTNTDELIKWCDDIVKELKAGGVRAHLDDRTNYSPGWKYNHWELKGVPLRVEVGAKELKANEIRAVRRYDGSKSQLPRGELVPKVKGVLDDIQSGMFKKAKEALDSKYREAADWPAFMKELNGGNVVLTPWCKDEACEKIVKEKSAAESKALSAAEVEVQLTGAAKTLCMPFDQKKVGDDTKCFACGKKAQTHVLWGRSY